MRILRLILINISLTAILFMVASKNVEVVYADTIRIGLESRYNNAQMIDMTNTALFFGTDVAGEFAISGQMNSPAGFSVLVDNAYYLDLGIVVPSFDEAYALQSGYGKAVVHFMTDGQFGIYVGPFGDMVDAMETQSTYGGTVTAPHSGQIRVVAGEQNLLVADAPLQLIDATGALMLLGGRSYRGIMEIGRQTGAGITPVNIVDVEMYLYSVVPSEMPASWNIEAVKAQAVTARSYTFTSRGSHAHLGYELTDTVVSQVYSGVDTEHPNSTRAVDETRGIMAFYNDVPILGTYFSSSGGYTESSEYVWIEAVPYLRAVSDNFEQGAMEWERSFSLSEINQLAASQNLGIGHITSVSTSGDTPGGRVLNLNLHGELGTHTLTGESIRTFFSGSAEGSLQSRMFSIVEGIGSEVSTGGDFDTLIVAGSQMDIQRQSRGSAILSASGLSELGTELSVLSSRGIFGSRGATQNMTQSTGDRVSFAGRGWGHGVGMSQFGANSMANQGFDYRQILQHYYTGVVVR